MPLKKRRSKRQKQANLFLAVDVGNTSTDWEDGLDYYSMTKYKSVPKYSFPHKLSDIMTACLNNGLQLVSFEEYGHDITNLWAHFEHFKVKPPMCYTLVAKK